MAWTQQQKDRAAGIDDLVNGAKRDLKAMTTHNELREWALGENLDNAFDFGIFKAALRKIGINYDSLREKTLKAQMKEALKKAEAIPDTAPLIRLWVAAVKGDKQTAFAIVDKENEPVWYGNFFKDDKIWNGDLISAEQSVASKAIWVAHQACKSAEEEMARLDIVTTCPELNVSSLKDEAAKFGLKLQVTIDDTDERALETADLPGFKNWKEHDLQQLFTADSDSDADDTEDMEWDD